MRTFIFYLVVLFFFSACTNQQPAIDNFNQEIWQSDKQGCKDLRGDLYKVLLENQDVLLGLNESEVIEYLGKPDQTELYSRNQKFFYYLIGPGSECGDAYENRDPSKLIFRFNATGLLSEITLYN